MSPEIEDCIVNYIRAGTFDHVAAQAAGVSVRTFYDWLARGRGEHPHRPATPKLRAFARRVDQARAEARLAAEVRVYREHPKWWLAHAARSGPDREGWTDPRHQKNAPSGDTIEDRLRQLHRLEAIKERDNHVAGCDGCPSALHEKEIRR